MYVPLSAATRLKSCTPPVHTVQHGVEIEACETVTTGRGAESSRRRPHLPNSRRQVNGLVREFRSQDLLIRLVSRFGLAVRR